MKATYQKPATEIVVLSTGTHLMDISNGKLGNGETPKGFDPTQAMNETDATSGNLSRRSVWDDEEEEDF
ncbi:MAG: hypothetical protein J6W19_09370 [Prevotella sp.]|nr:hypothetical protein [Prevotella sp.]